MVTAMKTYMNKEMVAALFFLMLNPDNGNSEENKLKTAVSPDVAVETSMQIEKWMIDEKNFNVKKNSGGIATGNERALVIEDWMMKEGHFSLREPNFTDEKESVMKIESWMVDPGFWKDK